MFPVIFLCFVFVTILCREYGMAGAMTCKLVSMKDEAGMLVGQENHRSCKDESGSRKAAPILLRSHTSTKQPESGSQKVAKTTVSRARKDGVTTPDRRSSSSDRTCVLSRVPGVDSLSSQSTSEAFPGRLDPGKPSMLLYNIGAIQY